MSDFADEIFDDDGYPTEEFLAHIRDWDFRRGHDDLLKFAMRGHIYENYWHREMSDVDHAVWWISTGGWSGNEDILGALQENVMFWALCWEESRRGGHYKFKCRVESPK